MLTLMPCGRAWAQSVQIPDEYEIVGGQATALSGGGVAIAEDLAAVRANPALLPLVGQYRLSASYHWPTEGREFYQAGVVDAKTSRVAAGVSYTGYLTDYETQREDRDASAFDSPLIRRGVVGIGQVFGAISAGLGATYVEAHDLEGGDDNIKGFGLNLGLAGAVTPQLRYGVSAENVSNRRIESYVPRTFRGGLSYVLFGGSLSAQLDFRQRERVAEFEGKPVDPDKVADHQKSLLDRPEQMVIGSALIRFQDVFRVLASYGRALSDDRQMAAGGVSIVNNKATLSYTLARPYLSRAETHQAISLSMEIAL